MRRITALFAVTAIAAIGLVAQASPASSGAGGGSIGYTSGFQFSGVNIDCNFYAIDLSTGAAEQRNTELLPCADGHTFAPDGTLYAFRNVEAGGAGIPELITIDPANGLQTLVGEIPTQAFQGSAGMTFDAAGNLFLYSSNFGGDPGCEPEPGAGWCLWQVNPADATTTFVGLVNEPRGIFGLAATCEQIVGITSPLAAGPQPIASQLQHVDTSNGAITEIVELPDVSRPQGLDYDASGGLWAIGAEASMGGGQVVIYSIDPATGESLETAVTVGGDPIEGFLTGLAISPTSCVTPPPPEPAPEVVLAPTFTG